MFERVRPLNLRTGSIPTTRFRFDPLGHERVRPLTNRFDLHYAIGFDPLGYERVRPPLIFRQVRSPLRNWVRSPRFRTGSTPWFGLVLIFGQARSPLRNWVRSPRIQQVRPPGFRTGPIPTTQSGWIPSYT
ncbi:unnamed protein product, partial [Pylaiella littoralis]